jgi:hypothetical protein
MQCDAMRQLPAAKPAMYDDVYKSWQRSASPSASVGLSSVTSARSSRRRRCRPFQGLFPLHLRYARMDGQVALLQA